VAERSPLFLGLVRPPKLFGLPIMYAVVWLFGTVLLFVWIQSFLAFHRCCDDGPARNASHQKQENPWRR